MSMMLDLDGVGYPFKPEFQGWAKGRHGSHLPDANTWHFYQEWGWHTQLFIEELSLFAEEGGFANAEPYPGTVEMVKAIAEVGHDIHVVTDRPEAAVADTLWWIDTYLPEVSTVSFNRDKTVFKELGRPTYYGIDDRIENVEALRKAGVYAYLLTQPWNVESDLPRVGTLEEFTEIVTRRKKSLDFLG